MEQSLADQLDLTLSERMQPAMIPNIVWKNINFTLHERCILGYLAQGYMSREEMTESSVSELSEWALLSIKKLRPILKGLVECGEIQASDKRFTGSTMVILGD